MSPIEDAHRAATAREAAISEKVAEISDWWSDHAQRAIDRTAPKAAEYGAADLDIMGAAMLALLPVDGADEAERAQIGRYAAATFYALGKVARQLGALQQGRLPGADCEFDLEVYAVMQARIRETGSWV